MLIRTRHYQSQPLAAAGQAPEWVHLIPAGVFKGVDGRGPYHVKNAAALIELSMANGKLPLDENHSIDNAAPQGRPSPAQGWIVEMQARDDGIWGRVEWTERGRQLMADQAYRSVSPVFDATKDKGEVVQLHRAALTNNPNLDLHPLHSRQETGLDLVAMRKALGLADTADDAAILAAVQAQAATVTAHAATIATHNASIAAIAAAAGATVADAAGLVTHLNAVKSNATSVETMASKVVALETELNTLKATGARAVAEAAIDAAITAGKPIASLRDHYITRHIANADAVRAELAALPSIHAGGTRQRHDAADGDALSEEDMAVCNKMGLDPKEFAKQKAKNASKGSK
jgi:phage I-like protein